MAVDGKPPMNFRRPCGRRRVIDDWRKHKESVFAKTGEDWRNLGFTVIRSQLNHDDVTV